MDILKPFLTILIAVIVYGVVHSFLASLWLKARLRHLFGAEFDRAYRLIYNGFAVISLVPVLALLALFPDRTIYSIPFPWMLINLAIQGLALVALAFGVWQTGLLAFLGLEQFMKPPSKKRPKLVVRGLYRYVRHPLYTAGLVLIWFTPVMTLNVFALNLGLTFYLLVGALVEERKLVQEYGAAYEEYANKTPMFLPGLSSKPGE
jgi:protein-S-isoprenylcysteine O-methyltransferase Ste14